MGDKAYRQRINAWVDEQWLAKDQRLAELLAGKTDAP